MDRTCWWLTGILSRTLEPDERDAVLGDIRESGETGAQALRDMLELFVRRQAAFWKNWRPWLVLVGLLSGHQAPLDLGLLLRKRITVVGTTLRGRPLEEKIAATRLFANQALPWLARGVVRPVVDSVFALEQAKEAYGRMESNQSFGKVILRP